MNNKDFKVVLPTTIEDKIALAAKILSIDKEDGDNSPLKGVNSPALKNKEESIANAQTYNSESEDYQYKSTIATKKRNLLIPDIDDYTKAVRDVLMLMHADNPRELTRWGFSVTASTKSKKSADTPDTETK